MGNIVTGSGTGEPSHPSVLSHEGVHSEKDRLSTRSLNTSSMNRHSAPTLLRNVHEDAPSPTCQGRGAAPMLLSVEEMLDTPAALLSVPPRVNLDASNPHALAHQLFMDARTSCPFSQEASLANAEARTPAAKAYVILVTALPIDPEIEQSALTLMNVHHAFFGSSSQLRGVAEVAMTSRIGSAEGKVFFDQNGSEHAYPYMVQKALHSIQTRGDEAPNDTT